MLWVVAYILVDVRKTTLMKKFILLITLLIPLVFAACKKDQYNQPQEKPETTDEIKVPSDFQWKTTKDVQLTITGKSNGLLEILSSKGITYLKVFITSNQASSIKVNVPSYETAVQLKYLGQVVNLELSSDQLTYQFE